MPSRSHLSHGAVAAVHALALDFDIAGIIDHHLSLSGRRDRTEKVHQPNPDRKPMVYDKGNMSLKNQSAVGRLPLHYVASLTVSSQRALLVEANARLEEVELGEGRKVLAYRTKRMLWEAERTLVVLVSERLRQDQLRGIQQYLASAVRFLQDMEAILRGGKQRRDKATLERSEAARSHRDLTHRVPAGAPASS